MAVTTSILKRSLFGKKIGYSSGILVIGDRFSDQNVGQSRKLVALIQRPASHKYCPTFQFVYIIFNHLSGYQCWGKCWGYNIALLPKKVTNYISYRSVK